MQDSGIREKDKDQINLENKENLNRSNYQIGINQVNQSDTSEAPDIKSMDLKAYQSRKKF